MAKTVTMPIAGLQSVVRRLIWNIYDKGSLRSRTTADIIMATERQVAEAIGQLAASELMGLLCGAKVVTPEFVRSLD